MTLAVVSELPGRVRWFLPELCDQEELAAAMTRALAALADVHEVRANPVTGRLLVRFDERFSTDRIEAEVLAALRAERANGRHPVSAALTSGFKATTVGAGAALVARVGFSLAMGPTLGVGVAAGAAWYLVEKMRRPAPAARPQTAAAASPSLLHAVAPYKAQIAKATVLSGAGALGLLVHSVSAGFALDVVITGSTNLLGVGFAGTGGAVVLVGVSIAAAVLRAWARHRSQLSFGDAARSLQDNLRNLLADRVLALETTDVDERKRRELQVVLTNDVNQLESAFDAVWSLGDMAVTAAVLLGGIFYISSSAGLIALLPVPALVGLSFLFAPRMQAAHAALRDRVVEIGGEVSDSLEGFETIKGFTAEEGQAERLRTASAAYREKSREAMRALIKFPLALETAVLGSLIVVTSVNGRLVRESTLSFGLFNAVCMLTSHLLFPLLTVGSRFNQVAAGRSSYARIQATLEVPVRGDSHLPHLPKAASPGEVVFRDVTFSYPGGETLFQRLSLRFPARQTTAVVGFSGSGKSTLIKLLLRFRDPDSGTIEIDGRDIATLQRRSVRQAVAVVSQDMKLLHRSIEDNIGLGSPDGDRADVERAARLAQAEDFIVRLPDGYATVLGREGTTISGGERQRLGIARALMKAAPILVFDEATSNVDSRTEAAIHDMLGAVRRESTVILIAHRLAIVRDADQIYLLDGGALAEQGTHDELLALNGKYRMLWEMQRGNWS